MHPREQHFRRTLLVLSLGLTAGALWFTPGVTAPVPWQVMVAGGMLASCIALSLLVVGLRRGRAPRFPLAICLLVAWVCISGLFSVDGHLCALSAGFWVAGGAVSLGIVLAVRSPAEWRSAAHVLVGVSWLASLWGWMDLVADYRQLGTLGRITANFTNPDCFAVIPMIGLLLGAGLMVRARNRAVTVYLLVVSVLQSATLLGTGSRAGMGAAVVGLVVFCLLLLNGDRRKARWRWLLAGAGPAVMLLFALTLPLVTPAAARWERLLAGDEPASLKVRLDVAWLGLRTSLDRPVTGSGGGTFHLAYQKHRPFIDPSEDYINVAHNDFIQILVELGWPGLCLWLGLCGLAFDNALHDSRVRGLACEASGAGGAVAGMVVFGLGNFAVPVPAGLLWWMTVLGMAAALPGRKPEEEAFSPLADRVLAAGWLLLGLGALAGGLWVARAPGLVSESRQLMEALRYESALAAADAAVKRAGGVEALLQRSEVEERLAFYSEDAGWLEKSLGDAEQAVRQSPLDLRARLRQYRLLARMGRQEEALDTLEQAHHNAPYEPRVRERLASVRVDQGNYEGAAEILAPVVSSEAERQVLATILVNLERSRPGRGVALLERWQGDPTSRQQGPETLERALAITDGRPEWAGVSERLYGFRLERNPSDLCARLGRARAAGLRGDRLDYLRRLETLLADEDQQEPCYQQALVMWARQTGGDTALRRLAQHLEGHPEASAVRVELSRLLRTAGDEEGAFAVIGEGLQVHADVLLLRRMGELQEESGDLRLALNYYRDALEADPGDQDLQRRIQRLEGRRE